MHLLIAIAFLIITILCFDVNKLINRTKRLEEKVKELEERLSIHNGLTEAQRLYNALKELKHNP